MPRNFDDHNLSKEVTRAGFYALEHVRGLISH